MYKYMYRNMCRIYVATFIVRRVHRDRLQQQSDSLTL